MVSVQRPVDDRSAHLEMGADRIDGPVLVDVELLQLTRFELPPFGRGGFVLLVAQRNPSLAERHLELLGFEVEPVGNLDQPGAKGPVQVVAGRPRPSRDVAASADAAVRTAAA
jgi:hypothetical protein